MVKTPSKRVKHIMTEQAGSISTDLEVGNINSTLNLSPLRTNSENKLGRVRLMSGETVGDLIDFVLELIWYRRADRIAALEKEHKNLAVTLLVFAWYASAIFAITTSKKIMLVLPMPYTLCAAQFTMASIIMFMIGEYYNSDMLSVGAKDTEKRAVGL